MAAAKPYFKTALGSIYVGDCLDILKTTIKPESVDLILTSPPFGLVRKKAYGNVDADKYLEWFCPFAAEFKRILKPNGSLVIDIGGAWIHGQPSRTLYPYELVSMLCRKFHFHLAQEFFWWNPAKLPSPAEWVTVRRIRVKDAVNCIWWLSPTPWPKATNRRVLAPYSRAMRRLLKNGCQARHHPSGHHISEHFSVDRGAAIAPNLLAIPNTESNSAYLRYCRAHRLPPHPARFPASLPEFFVRMLTDPGDLVVDPFGGSCVTGAVAERLNRRWFCSEVIEAYVKGALGRFQQSDRRQQRRSLPARRNRDRYYKLYHPSVLWDRHDERLLSQDGGRYYRAKTSQTHRKATPQAREF